MIQKRQEPRQRQDPEVLDAGVRKGNSNRHPLKLNLQSHRCRAAGDRSECTATTKEFPGPGL